MLASSFCNIFPQSRLLATNTLKTRKNGLVTFEGATVGILLAAGAGTRFTADEHKLHATIGGVAIWKHSLQQLLAAHIGPTIVVTGATPLELHPYEVHEVHNPDWAQGQATSLLAGVTFAQHHQAAATVIGLADQPGISPEAWQRLANADAIIATASYDGEPGHPVRIDASLWPQLPETGDFGARALLRKYEHLVKRIPCEGSPFDIDTTKDLDEWLKQSPTSSP
ncbi:MAG: molybdopterin-guanine dinucleotide biosynthesis protein A [Acidimicrobiaceae bacterium]|nr:molybdopterin-guanine dinucleotide biosynthesis protein A [Acidimicrobiaceae bacterium]